MSLDSKHPLYDDNIGLWKKMRDTFRGSYAVKEAKTEYLPATPGQAEPTGVLVPNTTGYASYLSYLQRAVFHDYVKEAVKSLVGMMHHKPSVIELPPSMESMIDRATARGESMAALLRRINVEQLVAGRLGLMADFPSKPVLGSTTPNLSLYHAERVINWDETSPDETGVAKLSLVVLDEKGYERDGDMAWRLTDRWRVLQLKPGEPYTAGLFTEKTFNEGSMIVPVSGGRSSDTMPFVFVNSSDLLPEPDEPPLLGLAELALAIYRGEADYRQTLYMQGQETLVLTGVAAEDDDVRVGADRVLRLRAGATAEYIGVSHQGLSEQREALENDKALASRMSGHLIDTASRERESGDALRIRSGARTATLKDIAQTGALGLQTLLRAVATWMGADPEKVVVTPNLDFVDDELSGKTLVEIMTARSLGAPISVRSVHALAQRKGLTDMTYEEEIEAIEEEKPVASATPDLEDDSTDNTEDDPAAGAGG